LLVLINFSLLNSALLINAFLISSRFFPASRNEFSSFLTYSFFFYLVQIVGYQILLGILGLLSAVWLSALVYATVITLVGFYGRDFLNNWKPFKISIRPLILILFSFIFVFGIVEFFNALIQPVWEKDSIAYHLPFVQYFISKGSILDVIFAAYRGPIGYYPSSGELYTAWYILPAGGDFLANIQNIILFIIGGICSFDLAKKLGISKQTAIFVPAVFLQIPIILIQIGAPYNDLFFTIAFAYIIYFIIEYINSKNLLYILPISFAFGLFVGTKFLGVTYGIFPFIILLITLIINFKRQKILKLLKYTGFGIVCFILTGGFWYIRNLYLTGNPIFPSELKFFGKTFLQGYGTMTETIFNMSISATFKTLEEYKNFFSLFLLRSGYQVYLLIASYVISIGLVLFLLIKKSFYCYKKLKQKINTRDIIIPVLFIISLPVYFYLYISAPYTQYALDANIRYAIVFLFIGVLLITYIADKILLIRPIMYVAILASIVCTIVFAVFTDWPLQQLFNLAHIQDHKDLFIVLVITILVGFAGLFYSLILKKYQLKALLISVIIIPVLLSLNYQSLYNIRENEKFNILKEKYPYDEALFEAEDWLVNNTKKEDVIAYSGFHFEYPLFTTTLDKNIIYVPINSCLNCSYYDLRNEKDTIFTGADKNIWLKNLQTASVDFLILFNQYGFMKYEEKWTEEETGHFNKIFDKNGVKIYRFI